MEWDVHSLFGSLLSQRQSCPMQKRGADLLCSPFSVLLLAVPVCGMYLFATFSCSFPINIMKIPQLQFVHLNMSHSPQPCSDHADKRFFLSTSWWKASQGPYTPVDSSKNTECRVFTIGNIQPRVLGKQAPVLGTSSW